MTILEIMTLRFDEGEHRMAGLADTQSDWRIPAQAPCFPAHWLSPSPSFARLKSEIGSLGTEVFVRAAQGSSHSLCPCHRDTVSSPCLGSGNTLVE